MSVQFLYFETASFFYIYDKAFSHTLRHIKAKALSTSLFHSVVFIFHTAVYVFHSVVFISHTVKQRNYLEEKKKTSVRNPISVSFPSIYSKVPATELILLQF